MKNINFFNFFFASLKKSFSYQKDKWKHVILISFLDIVFLFGLMIIRNLTFISIYPLVDPFFSSFTTEAFFDQLSRGLNLISIYGSNYPGNALKILLYLFMGLASLFILFVITQYPCYRMLNKIKLRSFITKSGLFYWISALIFITFSGFSVYYSGTRLGEMLFTAMYVIIIILLFMMIISLSARKRIYTVLSKRILHIIIFIVLSFAFLYLIDHILILAENLPVSLFFFLGLILTFPSIVYLKKLLVLLTN